MTLTLDTSGTVPVQVTPTSHQNVGWIDLTPFAQGYVEAALEAWRGNASAEELMLAYGSVSALTRFSDLSPDTLAAMMADCAGATWGGRATEVGGRAFWKSRQDGNQSPRFPTLTLYLSEDGLIHHREAS